MTSFLSSSKLGIVLIIIIVALCILGSVTGYAKVFYSWYFVSVVGLLWVNVLFCFFRSDWKMKKAGRILSHMGILIVLVGALLTFIFKHQGYMEMMKGNSSDFYIDRSGAPVSLDFKLRLDSFEARRYEKEEWKDQIKDFVSRVSVLQAGKVILKKNIEVNKPLKFGGYVFYQAAYDPKRPYWTALEVVKDPGINLVLLGFVLLDLGVLISLFEQMRSS